MTLEEMQIAVCEKLPKLLGIGPTAFGGEVIIWKQKTDRFGHVKPVNWPTEGLQVCHEAEKLLQPDSQMSYYLHLLADKCTNIEPEVITNWAYHATYEQRLEALCRVWFPEKFV